MLWNEQGQTYNYINSYEEISIPAGLSHRLKPARRAALAVEKVTAGRSFCRRQGQGTMSFIILVLTCLGEE